MFEMISITVVDSKNDSNQTMTVPAGKTVRSLLTDLRVDLDKNVVMLKLDGERLQYDLDDELAEGTRVVITPEQIKGA